MTQRFLDAGLVVFGKTNTPEFGAKGVTEPELWGPARSPWNLGHTPGGYSCSSAINASPDGEAVAAVESAAALLTDLGHEVEEVAPPHDDQALARDVLTIWFAQLYGQVADVKRRLGSPDSHFEADTLACAELGRAAGMLPLMRSLANVNDHIRSLAAFHETYDLFLTPTLAGSPLAIGRLTAPDRLKRIARGGGQGACRQAAPVA